MNRWAEATPHNAFQRQDDWNILDAKPPGHLAIRYLNMPDMALHMLHRYLAAHYSAPQANSYRIPLSLQVPSVAERLDGLVISRKCDISFPYDSGLGDRRED